MRQKSEVAGLGVGAVLLCATVAATKVDAFFSSSQRSVVFNAYTHHDRDGSSWP
ncbi:hypothetical protein JHK84_035768 [Glycine max]|nr:hypothetical protein JHK84_035768 [Glycine max]